MPTRRPLASVATLLFFSGCCALIYQVAWFRELRLIFGASTAASAAVLAVFMGGLGAGGLVLGKRADAARNPLAMYANLEVGIAVTAAITPLLVRFAQFVYLGLGGVASLGSVGATCVRLLLSVLVLGPSALLMGGTLPAAARAVGRADDVGRQRIATLYGVNTLGAVTGALSANFLLIEVFGTRMTLWLACLVNGLVAMTARAVARGQQDMKSDPPEAPEGARATGDGDGDEGAGLGSAGRWFPPLAAGVSGAAFMLMELVWYRMLAPLLGGSSYTFGLILALALAGIGLGGLLYSRTSRPASVGLFSLTCALEALTLALPFALGDRVAVFALLLRPMAQASFGAAVLAWTAVAAIVVLPTAIVSGYQFPVVIGLYGRGSKRLGQDVGTAYVANTIGSILGSISGGFGLLPLLTAPGCWKLVTVLLAATAVGAAALDVRIRKSFRFAVATVALATPAALCLMATGPTAGWRHSGIGAGRADYVTVSRQKLEAFLIDARHQVKWDADGRESSVALARPNGYTFIVNGKSDGSILGDSGTQIMSGLLAALLKDDVKHALVIGLGTGSTAGWLGLVPSVERVDVVELEPSIVGVARECAPANGAVLDNPKVHITFNDAREVLQTTSGRYDVVFSEPSNPYRAGISSLYTVDFYRSVAERLNQDGIFVQWIQSYEVDPLAVATAAVTLHQVFPNISIWQPLGGDLLLVASRERRPIDVDRIRSLVPTEPFRSALRAAWRTDTAEGVLSHFVAGPEFVDLLDAQKLGLINTDDQNVLEFAFARNVGNHRGVIAELRGLARRLDMDRPKTKGAFDALLVQEEALNTQFRSENSAETTPDTDPAIVEYSRLLSLAQRGDYVGLLRAYFELRRKPQSHFASLVVADAAARVSGDGGEAVVLEANIDDVDRQLLHAVWLVRQRRPAEAAEAFERGFAAMRKGPWAYPSSALLGLAAAADLGRREPALARRLAVALLEPFSVEAYRAQRLEALFSLSRVAGDPKLCVEAIDSVEILPMVTLAYETRVACYEKTNDPRLPAAREDLARLQAYTLPFGADVPSAPRRSTERRPSEPGDDAGAAFDPDGPHVLLGAAATPDAAAPSADAGPPGDAGVSDPADAGAADAGGR